ncbi:uncharacterized protein [Ambystoma mexicanum]|uniref:uncharacterized protein n=1 Tax=Ambystoma mexicanum TaxID=8296 RepID=UPI0037E9BCB9
MMTIFEYKCYNLDIGYPTHYIMYLILSNLILSNLVHLNTLIILLGLYIMPPLTSTTIQPPMTQCNIAERNARLRARLPRIFDPLIKYETNNNRTIMTTEPTPKLSSHNYKSYNKLQINRDKNLTPTALINLTSSPPTNSIPKLKGALINARSLVAHAIEMSEVITTEDYDFLAITETWLHEASGPALSLADPDNYTILRTDRCGARVGGLAIIAKTKLDMRLTPSPTIESCEIMSTKTPIANSQTLNLHLIYRPPGPIKTFIEDLSTILSENLKGTTQAILLGDLNIGFNDINDPQAIAASNILTELGYTQRVLEPTHIKGRTLDWIADHNCKISTPTISPQIWTDHHLISFSLDTTTPKLQQPCAPPAPTRNKKNMTLDKLLPGILPTLNALPNNLNPNDLVEEFNNIMNKTLDDIRST